MAPVDDMSWLADAKCSREGIELEEFYPPKHAQEGVRDRARRLCDGCPVQDECLAYALRTNERFGIWGGRTERERRAIKRFGQTATGEQIKDTG